MADTRFPLAQAVAAWLRDPATAPSEADNAELESAAKSISSVFGLSVEAASGPGLQTIYDVFVKTQQKMSTTAQADAAGASSRPSSFKAAATGEAASSFSSSSTSSPEDQAAAEKHKADGNKSMSAKDYGAAIASYTKAIELHACPVFYSNRAAAYSQVGQHDKAIEDAREAAKLDPKFGKAYSRLGHALFSSGRYDEAVEAYQQGLLVDPENKLMQSGLDTAKSQAAKDSSSASASTSSPTPATRDGAGAGAGGFPGMGGAGGMPDLASLMNNPMMQQMAQSMMTNGGLEQLMNNPMMRSVAERMGSGGGIPDMGSIQQMMQDPQMQALARQFMGGMGRGGGGGASGGAPGNMFG